MDRAWRRSWSGAGVASVLASGQRRRRARPKGGGRRWDRRHARLQGLLRRLLGRFGELHRPRRLFAGVDLKEADAVEAAREAIVGAADGELLVARAHEGLARPFAAAVVVDRVDVIEARHQRTAQHGFTTAGAQVPPALGAPPFILLV